MTEEQLKALENNVAQLRTTAKRIKAFDCFREKLDKTFSVKVSDDECRFTYHHNGSYHQEILKVDAAELVAMIRNVAVMAAEKQAELLREELESATIDG